MSAETAVVAFSGGLDTSFLVPYAKEKYGVDRVVTCTVDTGGYTEQEIDRIANRSRELGADDHVMINAEQEFYLDVLRFMIFGNVSRDGYPLCVGTERIIQACRAVQYSIEQNARYFLHGSTGAGNDQFRFDCAAHVVGGTNLETRAPIREFGITRQFATDYLTNRGVEVPKKNSDYSYNVGLWGTSIGGTETHDSALLLPDHAWSVQPTRNESEEILIGYDKGELCRLQIGDSIFSDPLEIIKQLTRLGGEFGIGRHYHVGTSIPGVKGRLAYESPAADIIYKTHASLEQVTLSSSQIFGKQPLANEFGRLVHEAKMFDPWLDDLRTVLANCQRRVTGTVTIMLAPGTLGPCRIESEFSLLKNKAATYGESAEYYDGEDARGACKLNAFEQTIWRRTGSP